MTMSLADSVRIFLNLNNVPDPQADELRRLERSNSVGEKWAKLFVRFNTSVSQTTLFRILEIKRAADWNRESPKARKEALEEYEELGAAAKLLRQHFDRVPISESDEGACESAATHNQKVRSLRENLAYAEDYFERLSLITNHRFDREFPKSQKRDQPHLAFGVLLCRDLKERTGSPAYGLVAAISAALYNRSSDGLQESIEVAYKKDR